MNLNFFMKKIIFFATALSATISNAATEPTDSLAESKSPSNFHIGVELQTKYIWRGQEMMVDESAPVIFSQLYYEYNGWRAYAKGGYATNGEFSQVNLGINYTHKWLNVGLTDYFFPDHTSTKDNYFDFENDKTGHLFEASVAATPKRVPLTFMVATIFAGNDKYDSHADHQAFSTYAEIGTWVDFMDANRLSLNVGMCNDRSLYNHRSNYCSVCSIDLKYAYNLRFTSGRTVPLAVAYIINPEREKAFVNFSASFNF